MHRWLHVIVCALISASLTPSTVAGDVHSFEATDPIWFEEADHGQTACIPADEGDAATDAVTASMCDLRGFRAVNNATHLLVEVDLTTLIFSCCVPITQDTLVVDVEVHGPDGAVYRPMMAINAEEDNATLPSFFEETRPTGWAWELVDRKAGMIAASVPLSSLGADHDGATVGFSEVDTHLRQRTPNGHYGYILNVDRMPLDGTLQIALEDQVATDEDAPTPAPSPTDDGTGADTEPVEQGRATPSPSAVLAALAVLAVLATLPRRQ